MPEEKTDSVLIQEALDGSLNAFDDLMRRYERLVYRVALSYAGDAEQVVDVVQNVFLKVYENLASLRDSGLFKAWLMRITHHESVNWIRRQTRHCGHDPVDEDAPISSGRSSQEEDLLERESAQFLWKSLDCLNPRQRLVVTLRYYESLSLKEIAELAGCSENMVKNTLFRSLDKLRRRLAGKRVLYAVS
jgi:RNA polymerase sigma-70 factor (ECF subfamily)